MVEEEVALLERCPTARQSRALSSLFDLTIDERSRASYGAYNWTRLAHNST